MVDYPSFNYSDLTPDQLATITPEENSGIQRALHPSIPGQATGTSATQLNNPSPTVYQLPNGGGFTTQEPNAQGYKEAPKTKKDKNFGSFLLPAAAGIGSLFLGPEIGLGLEGLAGGTFAGAETLGGALAGAGLGAAGSGLSGGNPLLGALEGGIGGAIGPNIGDITDNVFGTGTPGVPGGGGAPGAGGATPGAVGPVSGGASGVTSAPASVGAGGGGFGGDVTIDPSSFSSGGDFPTGTNGTFGGGSSGPTQFSLTGAAQPSSSFGSSGIDSASSSNFGSPPSSGNGPSFSSASGGGSGTPSSIQLPSGGGGNISGAGGGNSFQAAIDNPTFSNIGKALNNNSNLLSAGAGLGKDILSSLSPTPGLNELKGQAENLGGQGQQLQSYLNSGTLPPGVQGGINQAAQSAKAAIRSKYASMGMSGSSAEQQDLANVDTQAQTQGANIAMQLLQQGVQETGLSAEIYQELVKNSMTNDANFSSAFTNLASAIGGSSGARQ